MKRGTDKFRSFGKCTHGRNWGHLGGDQVCYTDATHERRGFPERLACQFHAFDAERSTPGDPNWIPFEGSVVS
jgi:hypothetical protein